MGILPPILILDDDPDDLFVFRRLLAKAGIPNKIIAFEDPAVAIEYLDLESRNPDHRFLPCVFFVDFQMPELSGIEVTQWVRSHPRLKHMSVIITSNSESPEDEQRAQQAGATRFLRKYPSSQGLQILIQSLPCTPQP